MVTQPIEIPQAFFEETPEAHQSQAALLLFLGLLAHRERRVGDGFVTAITPIEWDDLGIDDDFEKLGIPERIRALQEISVTRYGLEMLASEIGRDGFETTEWLGRPGERKPELGSLQADQAARLFEDPSFLNLAKLTAVSLHHANPLVRVAAASTYFDVGLGAGDLAGSVLLEGTHDEDLLVREVAATALARVAPDHPRVLELMGEGFSRGEPVPADTSLLVHGTWARNASWWQPGGNFHDYLLSTVDSTLYAGSDRFEWSGGYSDEARAIGAIDLIAWITGKGWQTPDLFTHSHGGNIAMLANRAVDLGRLVLLSCPVHRRKYWPNFGHVGKVVSVRVHMDLVILADRGGQRFRDPNIDENVLPLWFDHSASHDPDTWINYNVPSMI